MTRESAQHSADVSQCSAQNDTAPTPHADQATNGNLPAKPQQTLTEYIAARSRGQMTKYTRDKAYTACEMLRSGKSVRDVAAVLGVSAGTVTLWHQMDVDGFAEQYTRAREAGLDVMAEEMMDVARNATPETVQVARLEFDAKRWYLSKLAPKRYGDRVQQDVNVTVNVPQLIQDGEAKLAKVEQEAIEGEVIPD